MAKWSNKKKAAAVGGGIGAAAVVTYLLWPRPAGAGLGGVVAKLELVTEATSVLNADSSVTVTVTAVAVGGVEPYSFKITWPDGVTDSNGFGTFTRTFSSASVLPPEALVTVGSADGQSISVNG